MDWESGVSGCELLYREWINKELLCRESMNNEDLLCSTGNSVQYPVINRSGQEYEKERVCAYYSGNAHSVVRPLDFSEDQVP